MAQNIVTKAGLQGASEVQAIVLYHDKNNDHSWRKSIREIFCIFTNDVKMKVSAHTYLLDYKCIHMLLVQII